MKKKRLFSHLFFTYLSITFISLAIIVFYVLNTLHSLYIKQLSTELEQRAKLVKNILTLKKNNNIDLFCKKISKETGTRLTIIDFSGKVTGDSEETINLMDNHNDRPEIISAKRGKTGISLRYSHTLKKNMMYVAIPIYQNGKIQQLIRTSLPITFIDKVLEEIYFKIFLTGLLTALFVAIISFSVSKRLSKSIENIEKGAKLFAKGNFSHKLPPSEIKEFSMLSRTMNEMSVEIDKKINDILKHNNEQEAVFSNIAEGIIAVDSDYKIIKINQTALNMLNINNKEVYTSSINELTDNKALISLIENSIDANGIIECDIELENNKYVQTKSTAIKSSDNHDIEVIIVLNDITRLRKLENMRRDFVANVSHELKTPVTSIKGFVETLLDGALENKEDTERFLNIILKHSERISAIIEDLLSLSWLEQKIDKGEIILEPCKINDIIKAAIQAGELKASFKSINVNFISISDIEINANTMLLEQAFINLIINAIKYSDENKNIEIKADISNNEAIITVKDEGFGISSEHLPRIFERFYRVDKARSRKIGGTGLGLAIVKHIVQAHNGQIKVESALGKGTTFTISLPLNSQKEM